MATRRTIRALPCTVRRVLAGSLLWTLAAGCATVPEKDDHLKKPSEKQLVRMRVRMAQEMVQKKDYKQALPYLRDLRRKYPKAAVVHLLMGKVLRDKLMFKPARVELKTALELAPKAPEVHSAMGSLLDMEGKLQRKPKKHKAAEKYHREAMDLAPKEPRYHNNLGFCLFLQKRYEDAEKVVQEAIRLDPGMLMAFNNLGFILAMLDRKEEAMRAFNELGRHVALNNMGVVEEMKGRPLSARRYYERALREKKDFKRARANLEALEPQIKPPAKQDTTTAPSTDGAAEQQ